MLKFLTHKLRTHSINEDNVQEKVDGHDSGTESDGDLAPEDDLNEIDMEISMASRQYTTSPTDTACSLESPAFHGHAQFLYDQNSSEEELEVINGQPSLHANEESDDVYGSPKRASSIMIESRKRSLPHCSDDDVPAPVVNFRTSPPLEALKLHGYIQRSSTPSILTESGRGIDSIRISCDNNSSSISSQLDGHSISPPAKLFHCGVSPKRRPSRYGNSQRLQRLHRPCLDFDKMQQVKARSVTWRHNNEHTERINEKKSAQTETYVLL